MDHKDITKKKILCKDLAKKAKLILTIIFQFDKDAEINFRDALTDYYSVDLDMKWLKNYNFGLYEQLFGKIESK